MANLETLELRINANAQEAASGLSSLISSLSDLSEALIKPYADLRDFNEELKTLKKLGKIKLSIEGTQTFKSVEKTTRAVKENAAVSEDAAREFAEMQSRQDILELKRAGTLTKLAKELGKENGDKARVGSMTDTYQKLSAELEKTTTEANKATQAMDKQTGAMNDFQETVANAQGDEMSAGNLAKGALEAAEGFQKTTGAIQGATDSLALQTKIADANAEAWSRSKTAAMLFFGVNGKGEQLSMTLNEMKSYLGDALRSINEIGEEKTAGNMGISVEDLRQRVVEELRQRVAELSEEIDVMTGKMAGSGDEAVSMADRIRAAFGKVRDGLHDAFGGIEKLFSRIKRIATTMIIRKALRGLVSAMKEGLGNLYEWSKATGGTYASAMDEAKKKVLLLKNSLGAALSPVVQALIPLFNSLSSAIVSAANWINQFISLLSGKSSWTKAIETATDATEDMQTQATGAGNAAKEMLAAFDELNVISSETGGTGTGVTAQATEDYEGMFTEITKFDEKVKEIANFLKENLESIKALAGAVGAAILSWKLADAFAKTLPTLSTIFGYVATGAVIAITLQGTWMLTNEYLNTGDAGWLFTEALTTAVGSTVAAFLAQKLLGGQAAIWTASITLALSAIVGITADLQNVDVGAFSAESLSTLFLNALKAGAAVGLLLKTVGGASVLTSVAGGASAAVAVFAVALGLKAALDPNIELFSVEFLATAVGAAVAAGLATVLFTGSIPGAAIAAIATFGVLIGLKLATKDGNIKWGNLVLTEEQIQEYVKTRMFTAEANVLVDQIDATIQNKAQLEEDIRADLLQLNTELNILTLGMDEQETYNNIRKIIEGTGEDGLISKITDLCDVNIALLKLNFSNITAYDGEGNAIDSSVLLSAIPAWQRVKGEMEANGQELTKLLFKGATEQLTPDEQAYTQELLQKVIEMGNKITSSQMFAESAANFKTAAFSAMSKGSVEGLINAFKDYSAENESTIREGLMSQIESYYNLAELETDPELKAKWTALGDALAAGLDKTVSEELKKQNAPGAQIILDWLFSNHQTVTDFNRYLHPIEEILSNANLTPEGIKTVLQNIFKDNGFSKLELEAMEVIGFSGFDLLSEELQREILGYITVTPETISLLKEGLGLDASKIISFSNWSQFTANEKLQFLDSLKKSFGSQEALNAAKKAGIDVGNLVAEGMDSSDPEIKKIAKEWNGIITEQVDDKTHTSKVGMGWLSNLDPVKKTQKEIEKVTGVAHAYIAYSKSTWLTDWHPVNKIREVLLKYTTNANANTYTAKAKSTWFTEWTPVKKIYTNLRDYTTKAKADTYIAKAKSSWFGGWDPVAKIYNNLMKYTTNAKAGTYTAEAQAKFNKDNTPEIGVVKPMNNVTVGKTWFANAKAQFSGDGKPETTIASVMTNTVKSAWEAKVKALFGDKSSPADTIVPDMKNIGNTTYSAYVAAKIDENNTPKRVVSKSMKEVGTQTVNVGASVTEETKNTVKTSFEAIKPTVTINGKVADSFGDNLGKAVTKGIDTALGKVKIIPSPDGTAKIEMMTKANGGLVNSGDIFIANENGRSEMIGRIGNQTAVANQEQMVEAMARGVEYAQAGQNALLREQNSLLRAILQKDNSVKIGASSALGRTVRQSLDMYGALVGG